MSDRPKFLPDFLVISGPIFSLIINNQAGHYHIICGPAQLNLTGSFVVLLAKQCELELEGEKLIEATSNKTLNFPPWLLYNQLNTTNSPGSVWLPNYNDLFQYAILFFAVIIASCVRIHRYCQKQRNSYEPRPQSDPERFEEYKLFPTTSQI